MRTLKKHVGARLRQLREEKRMSVLDLATSSGISRSAIYNVESGRYFPSLESLGRMAQVLRVDELDFLCFPEAHARHALIDRLRGAPVTTVMDLLDAQKSRAKRSAPKNR